MEDFLAKTNADEVEATPTPSHRSSKHQKTAYSPFVFLFALYYHPAQSQDSTEAYIQSAGRHLDLLAGARGSASGTIGLLHRTLQFCVDQHPYTSIKEELWAVMADATAKALERQTSASLQHNSQTVGIALRSALNIIMFGLRTYPFSSLCSQKAAELYGATCEFAKHYGGDGGVALGVTEPLAKSLLDMHDELSVSAGLEICKSILENGVWPKSRQELEHGRKALWSVSLDPPSKTSTALFDPYDHIYILIDKMSQKGYKELAEQGGMMYVGAIVDYFTAAVHFLLRCPPRIIPSSLKRIQEAIAVFAGDRERAFFPLSVSETVDGTQQAATELCTLWSEVLRFVQHSTMSTDSALLETLEPILVAGLSSPSKEIVNRTITFWNESFGAQDILDYPPKLLPVLRARRTQADIQLPGLGDDDSDSEIVDLPAFAESQGGSPNVHTTEHRSPRPTIKPLNMFLNSPFGTPGLSATGSASKKRTKSSRRSTPIARLRHDDSQLEFAPIECSPSRSAVQESQMLTEHQKEVMARQHGDAQMFPELSSSPGRSESKTRNINKKLDFSSDAARDNGNEALATPTAPADNNPMSDDLPSSPTPRASGHAPEADQMSDDEATDIIDPSSSPPRRAEDLEEDELDRVDETTIITDSYTNQNAAVSETKESDGHDLQAVAVQSESEGVVPSDMVSDNLLPTAQLEREAAAAGTGEESELHEVEEEEKFYSPAQAPHNVNETEDHNSQTPSRIEESFVQQSEQTASPSAVDSTASTPRGSRAGRNKRQRALDATDSPRKKAKKATPSPIKELWRRLTSSPATPKQNDDEDDEIGEEIVVASRPRPSPNSQASQSRSAPEPTTEVETVTDSQEQQHIKRQRGRPRKSYSSQQSSEPEPAVQSQPDPQQPVKRGRGRPRKNPLPQVESSQPTSSAISRKRRASVISTADSTSIVADTPAPAPTTRKAARLSQGATDAGSARREAENVSPKNLLARLYGVLADIPKMVFGGQEEEVEGEGFDERAFDDVLFEMRRAVFEVGRRGREGAQ